MITLFRVIKNAFINFWRNIWLSTAATLIMVITLTILTLTLLVVNLSNIAIKNVQERVDISVYFKNNVTENQIFTVRDNIARLPQVADITYISQNQALDIFRQKHANDALILESLNELNSNPLPPTLQIKAKQLDQYGAIAQALSADQYKTYIDKVNFEDNRAVIERLSKILQTIKKFGIGLAAVFSFIAIMVIFNTIRLTIYNRREEVEIMRLVGATSWYIRWPFIFESMFYSLAAAIISFALMLPLFNYITPKINSYLGINIAVNNLAAMPLYELFLVQLGVALLLGILSSLIAIRRYLRI